LEKPEGKEKRSGTQVNEDIWKGESTFFAPKEGGEFETETKRRKAQ